MRFQKMLLLILTVVLTAGCSAETEKTEQPDVTLRFFSVGKADSTLITWDDHAVLIDAATNKEGENIAQYLADSGVDRLDALFITHFDKDHVGGADKILESVQVDCVVEAGYDEDNKQTGQYREALEDAGITATAVHKNTALSIGGLDFEIDVPDAGYEQENDLSLVIRAVLGRYSVLFAGDAENDRLAELLDQGNLQCDILKMPHHGGYERLTPQFVQACSAKYAVITSSDEDPEDEETVLVLENVRSVPLFTKDGDVVIELHDYGICLLTQTT